MINRNQEQPPEGYHKISQNLWQSSFFNKVAVCNFIKKEILA